MHYANEGPNFQHRDTKYRTSLETCVDCAIELFNAGKKLRNKESLLRSARRQSLKRRQGYDGQWEQLAVKQEAFKTMFKRFNKFIRENQEKRDRAARKISEEIELQGRRSIDIAHMQEHYRHITNVKNLMEKKIKDHKMYEDYLIAVVKSSNAVKNVNEILFRYESLLETKAFLSRKQQSDLSALEHAQSNMMKLVEDKVLTLVGLQNQLASLQERYDLAYAKSLQWESTVSKIQDICSRELSNIFLVKRSIENTFLDMDDRRKLGLNLSANDYQSKLAFIKKTLALLATSVSKSKIHSRFNH